MEFKQYIAQKKRLYLSFTEYLEATINDDISDFENLIKTVKMQNVFQDNEKTKHFLYLILSFIQNHHREPELVNKICRILTFYGNEIKQIFSNIEIYEIFKSNKLILLFLLNKKILIINNELFDKISNSFDLNVTPYCYFFFPEIKKVIKNRKIQSIENEILQKIPNFYDDYEIKRQIGENDSYICTLVRNDSIDEFVSYFTRESLKPSTLVPYSIFETNQFLIDNKITLFEYAAFFGSIQIFRFLYYNQAEITLQLWLCAIHSKNPELIHLLEEISHDSNDDLINIYKSILLESIKCNHNDLAYYIQNNLFEKSKFNISQMKIDVVDFALRYYNFAYIPNDYDDCEFFPLCCYNYLKDVNIILKIKENEILEFINEIAKKKKLSIPFLLCIFLIMFYFYI